MTNDKPWRDEELMRKLYHEKRMSQREIADHFDNEITPGGIGYCLDELGIEKRSRAEAARIRWLKELPSIHSDVNGYEFYRTERDGDERKVLIHRLLAVAEYGLDAVKGKDVHHKNNIPWDNRLSNLELMTRPEHVKHHSTGQHDEEPWHDEDLLRELRIEKGMTLGEMADRLGCSDTTVWRSLRMYHIEDGGGGATA